MRLGEGDGFVVAVHVGQVVDEQSRLRLAVHIFRGLGGEFGQIACAAGERFGQDSITAHRQRQAAGPGLHEIAADVQVMTESLVQQSSDLADRDAGVGNIDLDVAGPVIVQMAFGGGAAGRGLQPG